MKKKKKKDKRKRKTPSPTTLGSLSGSPGVGRSAVPTFGIVFSPLDKIATAFGQRVFRCPAPPLLYWSFKCNVKLFHLQRCFSTQYKIPYHLSPPANQSTSSRSRRNKASPSPTAPTTHPPHIQCCLTSVRDTLGYESSDSHAPSLVSEN